MRYKSILFVFCCWPILNFINQNKEQLGQGDYVVLGSFFALTLVVPVTLSVLGRWVFGQAKQPNIVAALVALLILFFNYHVIIQVMDQAFAFLGWQHGSNYVYLLLLLTLPLVAFVTCKNKVVVEALLVAGLAALLVPTLPLSYYFLTTTHVRAAHATYAGQTTLLRRSPNIYYLMTDSYPRQDQLLQLFQYDNAPFLGYLTEQGFYVAEQAYANYPATFISLASALWMDYPVTDTSPHFADRQMFYAIMQGQNPVVSYLKAHGYAYLHMSSGRWAGSKCGGHEDLCLANNDELPLAFSSMTPLTYFKRTYSITTPASLEQRLDSLAPYQPFFLLTHIHSPHPPRTFDPHCQQNLGKAKDFSLWKAASKPEYLNDVRCTNQQLRQVLDKILSRDPQAIILLHSDHGTAYSVNWRWPLDQWPRHAFEERFSILMALRLPAECRPTLYPALSPVNIFRVTFACLEGRPPDTLADVSYISTYEEGAKQYGWVHKYTR